ncbi:uncharacterized protein [Dendrobates tinctorius]|uniref:uncharacterized protein n=1 Tax=Dendrobates tinctorius TaxID=92724 RepID=UPI003CCA5862
MWRVSFAGQKTRNQYSHWVWTTGKPTTSSDRKWTRGSGLSIPKIFRRICYRWGTPDVDLIASHLNAKVSIFMARTRGPRLLGTDALVQDWTQFQLLYIFPPLPLMARVMRKIKQEGVPTILIAPDWPRHTWYADILQHYSRHPLVSSRPSRSPVSRPVLPPEFRDSQFDGVVLETWVLTQAGFAPDVIRTMIRARKPAFAKVYYRTWKTYFTRCDSRGRIPFPYSLPKVRGFLQSGLDAGLSLGSLKGQVSALSVLFQKRIANKPQVRTFLQGVSRLVPPYRRPLDTWDLNLVLTALQAPPFFNLLRKFHFEFYHKRWSSSWQSPRYAGCLSCQHSPANSFSYSSTRTRWFSVQFHPSFQRLCLISTSMRASHYRPFARLRFIRVQRARHTLDLARALRTCVSRTPPFRKSDSFFFLVPEGICRGLPASKATLARWIRSTIHDAYRLNNSPIPAGITAHSTRAVGASWAIRRQASAQHVC